MDTALNLASDGPPGAEAGGGFMGIPFDPKLAAENNAKPTIVVSWIMFSLAIFFVVLRLYAKLSRGRPLWWDDHVLIASSILMLANAIVLTHMTTLGYGKHNLFVPFENIPDLALWGNVTLTFVVTMLAWTKTSFAFTLLRFTNDWIKKIVWFIIISMNVLFFWCALVHWIYCKPLNKAWNPFLPGQCWEYKVVVNFDILAGAYSATMDVALSIIAWYMVRGLRMNIREKIGVIFSMSLGGFAAVFAIVKCTYLPTMLDNDVAYTGTYLAMWGMAEIAATIVAACVPILRALVAEKTSTNRSRSRSHGLTGPGTGVTNGLSSTARGNHWSQLGSKVGPEDGGSDVALQQVKGESPSFIQSTRSRATTPDPER